jgi:formylglycine-generating enzyme
MPGAHGIALAVGAILGALSLLHVYWCVVGIHGDSLALPEADGRPIFVPSRLASATVAGLLALAAVPILAQGGVVQTPLASRWLRLATGAISLVFLARAVGDFRFVGFGKRVRGTRFATWDDRLFSPLCLVLGAATLWLSLRAPVPPAAAETWIEPHSGLAFVRIPAGEFTMGSPPSEPGREPQERQHRVRISRPFLLGTTEVTQRAWQRVMGANPSHFGDCGPSCPVENVSAEDIERFLERLAAASGHRFRLPSEAEWEYACRAGGAAPFATGDTLSPQDANFDTGEPRTAPATAPPAGTTMPVASFPPNRWGLHDLHGNVWEWTADRHCDYAETAVTDPRGDCASPLRVLRGGSWHYGADSARCALRYTHAPANSGFSLGFRLARDVEAAPAG